MRAGDWIGEGSYKLISALGGGGFGKVFLAEGPSGLVAVKVVETSAWSEREYQVFNALLVSEASFLSTLDHPALPKLKAFFAEASRYYLVMEWVSGKSLEQQVRTSQRLPLDEALDMLGQLLDVLGYLHDGCRPPVVFGDLKPANVLRTREGVFRLVDLGLATREGTHLTGSFAVLSPFYSAPERAEGEASERSHDIYSLAATTVFALTGIPPQRHFGGAESSVRKAIANQDLGHDRVGQRRLEQVLTLLLAGLDPDSATRPRSLQPLREAYERWETVFLAERGARVEKEDPGSIMRSLYRSRVSDLEN